LAGFRSSLACTASRTASCSQREIRRSLPVVHWPLQGAALASCGPIAPQCLAVLFIGEVID
jgi:hypothetical protein